MEGYITIQPKHSELIALPASTDGLTEYQRMKLKDFLLQFAEIDFSNLDALVDLFDPVRIEIIITALVQDLTHSTLNAMDYHHGKDLDSSKLFNSGFRYHEGHRQRLSIFRLFLHYLQLAKPLFNIDGLDSAHNNLIQLFYNTSSHN